MTRIEIFEDRDRLADAAAAAMAEALGAPGARSVVLTGGSTPGPAYDRLSRAPLDWPTITVTLTDDRWVDPASDDSNERLLRARLLVAGAAKATFLPLKTAHASPREGAASVDSALRSLTPFAGVLLGMGADGHVASLFPGDPDLAAMLDPHGERLAVGVAMSGEKPYVPRISLTLRALLDSAIVVILVSGDEKRRVLDRVRDDPAFTPPVASILRQDRTPARVLWAA
ncbi:MAG TPA: 6-phosphogluconolactonase [Caulobacteraceae bacterium]|nr:6-phosphogluconolactonase [Caulobacteraceae bacterium]